jgi:hypothetical protein
VGTEAEIILFVQRTLGSTVVDCELTTDQAAEAVTSAKMWYAHYIGQYKSTTITLTSGLTEYAVPTDCDAIVEVVSDAADSVLTWGGFDIPVNLTPILPRVGAGSGYISDLTQMLQYTGAIRRTVARDQDWYYDEARRILVITPTTSGASMVRIWYMANTVDVQLLKYYEFGLVREYALAQAMENLGNIRSKYSEMPGAAGGFSMNGDLLASNAMTRKQELTDQLLKLQPPVGFIKG